MKYLVGDIGNTSTKVCILNSEFKIIKSFNFETIKIYKKNFLKSILRNYLNKSLNQTFLFSSVVPTAFKEIKKNFKELIKKNLKKNIYAYQIEQISKSILEKKLNPIFPGFTIEETEVNTKILEKLMVNHFMPFF